MRIFRRSLLLLVAVLALLVGPLAHAFVVTLASPISVQTAFTSVLSAPALTGSGSYSVFFVKFKHPQQAQLAPQLKVKGAVVTLVEVVNPPQADGSRMFYAALMPASGQTSELSLKSTSGAAISVTPTAQTTSLMGCRGTAIPSLGTGCPM